MHWATQYVGLPWDNGAQGPQAFDCWGFVRFVEREHFGRALPIISVPLDETTDTEVRRQRWLLAVGRAFRRHPERARWAPVERPEEGDGVVMSRARDPWHVGVWIAADGGGVLHCIEGAGVVFNARQALAAGGWGRVEFYRFVGDGENC